MQFLSKCFTVIVWKDFLASHEISEELPNGLIYRVPYIFLLKKILWELFAKSIFWNILQLNKQSFLHDLIA